MADNIRAVKRLSYALAVILAATAIVATIALIGSDLVHHGRQSNEHQKAGALSLMGIGLAYIIAYLRSEQSAKEKGRATLLGLAFFLWGAEQFFPETIGIAVVDSLVIVIFVLDLGYGLVLQLKKTGDSSRSS